MPEPTGRRALNKLTAMQVARMSKRGLFSDGGGLYLRVGQTLTKSWMFRYALDGKERYHGLGSVNTISLAEARDAARACRKLLQQGIDPIEAAKRGRQAKRLEQAKGVTFADCAREFIDAQGDGWKNQKHRQQWARTLEQYAYPVIGDLPVASIDTPLVVQIVKPIWSTKNETARRVRGRIEKVLKYAKSMGYRQGENPALWSGNLEFILPARDRVSEVEHHSALPYAEMPAFWKALDAQTSAAAQALRLTILAATRTSETLKAKWDEFDLNAKLWVVPAKRMKMGREHRIPLSGPAMAVLRSLEEQRTGEFLFPGAKEGKPLSNMAMTMVLRRMKRDDITVHGFRSTFRDWAAECVENSRELAEEALAHKLVDKVEAAYRRTDLCEARRPLMEAWARYCSQAFDVV